MYSMDDEMRRIHISVSQLDLQCRRFAEGAKASRSFAPRALQMSICQMCKHHGPRFNFAQ